MNKNNNNNNNNSNNNNRVCLCTQNTLVNNAVIRWGTEKQKEQWLPRLAQDTVGSFCLSYGAAFFCDCS